MSRRVLLQKIGSISTEPNVFIGGVGATSVTSPADFVSLVFSAITVANITNFNIDLNDNVSFRIDIDYVLDANVFLSDSDLTYYVDTEHLTSPDNSTFRLATSMNIFKALNPSFVFSAAGSDFRAADLTYIDYNDVTELSARMFQDNSNVEYVRHKNLLSTGTVAAVWAGCSSTKRIYVPNCTAYRTSLDVNSPFRGIGIGTKIYVPVSMLTVDGGQPHPALKYAVDTRSAVLVGVVNQTAPSAISDLSASSITATGFDADFTPPSSTNTLDYYHIWVERQDLDYWHKDRVIQRNSPYQEILASGDSITGLISGVTYKVKCKAGDIYGNESGFSNEIEITIL